MLSERQLEEILQVFRHRAQAVTEEYLIRMGQHLRDIGTISGSDINRLVELKRMNYNMEQIKRQIAKAAEVPLSEVETIFRQVAESDLRFASKIFGTDHTPAIKDNPALERILKAQAKITKQTLTNLSQTTILSDGYKNAVDVAVQTAQAGVSDYNSAIRRAMKAAARDGLRVQYPNSGLTRRLDSAVRMNVLDGIRAINQDVMRQVGKEFGADGIELTAHNLCAEDHLPYQGLQMSNKEFDRLQNTILDRPFGMWNCRHSWHPILLGISQPAYSPEELADFKRNSRERIEIDGVTKTRYEWTQEQRRIETAIRYQKDIAVAAKASGDMVARRECAYMIRELDKYYSKITDAAGLLEKREKMRVAGFSAVKPIDALKNPPKYDIIKADGSKTYMRIYNADGKEKFRYLKTDAIQKLDSTEAIAQYFFYTDKYDDWHSPLSNEFSRMLVDDVPLPPLDYYISGYKLSIQKEIAEGIEWARQTYKLDGLPLKITKGKVGNKADGEYEETTRRITLKNSLREEEAFVTTVHEMTHYADHMHGNIADSVCTDARKNLNLRVTGTKYFNYAFSIAGKRYTDPAELLAHAMEYYAGNTSNPLANEIAKIFIERMGKT